LPPAFHTSVSLGVADDPDDDDDEEDDDDDEDDDGVGGIYTRLGSSTNAGNVT
jgi:hypothetical protein